jgi:hypothetical protein
MAHLKWIFVALSVAIEPEAGTPVALELASLLADGKSIHGRPACGPNRQLLTDAN